MMGRQEAPAQLFYDFDLERNVPADHTLREIDLLLDGDSLRDALRPFYSHLGRPSIDRELIIRMLVIGYVMGIRSERRLCDEVHLNLTYRWFCRLGLEGKVPDHSTEPRQEGRQHRLQLHEHAGLTSRPKIFSRLCFRIFQTIRSPCHSKGDGNGLRGDDNSG